MPDIHTEEVAEVRHLEHFPQIPERLSRGAIRSRLLRAGPLLMEDPGRAVEILAAPVEPSSAVLEA